MKRYETSAVTLRVILSHPSLQHDKIEKTMDALHTETEDAKDVDSTIRAEQATIIDERGSHALVQDAGAREARSK